MDPGASDWRRIDLSDEAGVTGAQHVVVFVDPFTGRVSIAAQTAGGVVLIEELAGGGWRSRNLTQEISGATPITGSLFTLTPQDGLVLVGGKNADGDVVVYGMTAATGANGRVWAYDNLFQSQLRDNGLPVPELVGDLVPYVTSWNGLNVAAIDANGDIRVLWTAPGVGGGAKRTSPKPRTRPRLSAG